MSDSIRHAARLIAIAAIAAIVTIATMTACSGDTVPDPAPPAESRAATGWFTDVTEAVGLDFVHESKAEGNLQLPEIMGAGVALFDHDGDGDLDAYLTSGDANRLYSQEADGSFVDATARSGLGDRGYGLGVAVGDVNNDGAPDVYVANLGPDRLYLNRGDGTFADATGPAGIRVDGFSCSAVFCDYDLDGHLDLYVTRYVRHDPDQVCRNSSGQRDYCSPRAFTPMPDVLLRNQGDGTFEDVTAASGIGRVAAAGLGVVCDDLNGDGRPDFYAANDQYANHLWINEGNGRFRERALLLGVAYNLEGRTEAGMGILAADLDGDVDLDLYVTHLARESNTFYRHLHDGLFEDATGGSGLAQSSLPFTGFGAVAFDAELDGDLDLMVANGRVFRGPAAERTAMPVPWTYFAEPNLFYLGRGDGGFDARDDLADAFTLPVEISRGLAMGDVDSDGDVDVLLANIQSGARLYRNDAPRAGSWLRVRAIDPRLGRDALGARLTLVDGDRRTVRTVTRGGSYLSSHDVRAHFGLAGDDDDRRIEVRWPDGLVESFPVTEVDTELRIVRGEGS